MRVLPGSCESHRPLPCGGPVQYTPVGVSETELKPLLKSELQFLVTVALEENRVRGFFRRTCRPVHVSTAPSVFTSQRRRVPVPETGRWALTLGQQEQAAGKGAVARGVRGLRGPAPAAGVRWERLDSWGGRERAEELDVPCPWSTAPAHPLSRRLGTS